GLLQWLRFIGDLARNQTAFTVVTNTGTARPTDRDVASLGQFQNALVGRRIPVCGDATSRERYQRTGVGVVLRQMWSSRYCADDTGSHRLAAIEDLDMNPLRRHVHGCERLPHICHEAGRTAEVDIRLSRDAALAEDRSRYVTGGVEILALLALRAGPAVTNIAAAVGEGGHEAADFCGKWMMLPVASRMQPQDLPCRVGRRQRVQHCQDRRRSDSRAEQHHGPLPGLQDEASTRQADVENIAHPDMLPQVGSSRSIRLDFHADPIAFRREGTRERVATKERRADADPSKSQDYVLTGQSRLQRLIVRMPHQEGKDVRGLLIDRYHGEWLKSWCDRMRSCCRREPCVAAARPSRLSLQ